MSENQNVNPIMATLLTNFEVTFGAKTPKEDHMLEDYEFSDKDIMQIDFNYNGDDPVSVELELAEGTAAILIDKADTEALAIHFGII